MQPIKAQQSVANARLAKYWTQIANNFKNNDDTLLFAGTNEVMVDGDYGTPTAEYVAVQNGFNQVFVNTVRATGGNNAKRHLAVQGYYTSIEHTVATNTVPKDSAANRLFMEVHYYDPYNFTLNGDSKVWQWGSIATDAAATETWANEAWADKQFQSMKTAFVDKGVAVIVGEYGAYPKPKEKFPDMGRYSQYWAKTITHSIVQHGLVPMWWDTGGLIDRVSGAQKEPELVKLIVEAAK
jgi:endoglucanase